MDVAVASSPSADANDVQIEELLSQKLMEGFDLLDGSCPACYTPLVRRPRDDPTGIKLDDLASAAGTASVAEPYLVPSASFLSDTTLFVPVAGVPLCVCCKAHVVTQESDIYLLERCDPAKHKGNILVALEDDDETEVDSKAVLQPVDRSDDAIDHSDDAIELTMDGSVSDEAREALVPAEPLQFKMEILSEAATEPHPQPESEFQSETQVELDSEIVSEAAVEAEAEITDGVATSAENPLSPTSTEVAMRDFGATNFVPTEPTNQLKPAPPVVEDEGEGMEQELTESEYDTLEPELASGSFVTTEQPPLPETEVVNERKSSPFGDEKKDDDDAMYQAPFDPAMLPKVDYNPERARAPTYTMRSRPSTPVLAPTLDDDVDNSTIPTNSYADSSNYAEKTPIVTSKPPPSPPTPVEEPLKVFEEPVETAEEPAKPTTEPVKPAKEPTKPTAITETALVDDYLSDYSVRREIATKVLGAKMLQGYVLKETQCEKCNMPLMELKGVLNCVVCPALAKKAKKKMKEQQKLAEQQRQLEAEIAAAKEADRRQREFVQSQLRIVSNSDNKSIRVERVISNEDTFFSAPLEDTPTLPPSETSTTMDEEELEAQRLSFLQRTEEERERARQKLMAEERARLREEHERERKIRVAEEARLKAEKEAEDARIQAEKEAEEARLKAEKEAEEARIAKEQAEEAARVAAYEAEEKRLLEEARIRAQELEEERLKREAIIQKEARLREEKRIEAEKKLAEERRVAFEQRRKEVDALLEETRRLERMEHDRKLFQPVGVAVSSDDTPQTDDDIESVTQHANLRSLDSSDDDIPTATEIIRGDPELDTRRAEEESMLIRHLEVEAAAKAKAAEEAIKRAKAALECVSSARKDMIAQTIALAEAEAVAEAEGIIKAESENYKAPEILPSASEIKRERWETLRYEGRGVMSRRIMAGWTLLSEFCEGAECANSPLLAHGDRKECSVCKGTGNGKDGVYLTIDSIVSMQSSEQDIASPNGSMLHSASPREGATTPPLARSQSDLSRSTLSLSPTAGLTVQELQDKFEAKRSIVSQEIGRRMMEGWVLLDASCPICVMPLMSDADGNGEVCVLCGPVDQNESDDDQSATAAGLAMIDVLAQSQSEDNEEELTEPTESPMPEKEEEIADDESEGPFRMPVVELAYPGFDDDSSEDVSRKQSCDNKDELPPSSTQETSDETAERADESLPSTSEKVDTNAALQDVEFPPSEEPDDKSTVAETPTAAYEGVPVPSAYGDTIEESSDMVEKDIGTIDEPVVIAEKLLINLENALDIITPIARSAPAVDFPSAPSDLEEAVPPPPFHDDVNNDDSFAEEEARADGETETLGDNIKLISTYMLDEEEANKEECKTLVQDEALTETVEASELTLESVAVAAAHEVEPASDEVVDNGLTLPGDEIEQTCDTAPEDLEVNDTFEEPAETVSPQQVKTEESSSAEPRAITVPEENVTRNASENRKSPTLRDMIASRILQQSTRQARTSAFGDPPATSSFLGRRRGPFEPEEVSDVMLRDTPSSDGMFGGIRGSMSTGSYESRSVASTKMSTNLTSSHRSVEPAASREEEACATAAEHLSLLTEPHAIVSVQTNESLDESFSIKPYASASSVASRDSVEINNVASNVSAVSAASDPSTTAAVEASNVASCVSTESAVSAASVNMVEINNAASHVSDASAKSVNLATTPVVPNASVGESIAPSSSNRSAIVASSSQISSESVDVESVPSASDSIHDELQFAASKDSMRSSPSVTTSVHESAPVESIAPAINLTPVASKDSVRSIGSPRKPVDLTAGHEEVEVEQRASVSADFVVDAVPSAESVKSVDLVELNRGSGDSISISRSEEEGDGMTINIPGDFDFNDKGALERLLAAARNHKTLAKARARQLNEELASAEESEHTSDPVSNMSDIAAQRSYEASLENMQQKIIEATTSKLEEFFELKQNGPIPLTPTQPSPVSQPENIVMAESNTSQPSAEAVTSAAIGNEDGAAPMQHRVASHEQPTAVVSEVEVERSPSLDSTPSIQNVASVEEAVTTVASAEAEASPVPEEFVNPFGRSGPVILPPKRAALLSPIRSEGTEESDEGPIAAIPFPSMHQPREKVVWTMDLSEIDSLAKESNTKEDTPMSNAATTGDQPSVNVAEQSEEPNADVIEHEVIHIEDLTSSPAESPRKDRISFDSAVSGLDSTDEYADTPKNRRPCFTPESMSRGRTRPRRTRSTSTLKSASPDSSFRSSGSTTSSIPPRSPIGVLKTPGTPSRHLPPRSRSSPRSSGQKSVFFVGLPNQDKHDDMSIRSENSVASQTLESILQRIEEAKASLLSPSTDMKTQVETASLIERLASAAIAMKKLEGLSM